MIDFTSKELTVTALSRLDVFLTEHLEGFTRSFFQRLIQDKQVLVNEAVVTKSGYEVKPGDIVQINFTAYQPPVIAPFDRDLGVALLFEHPDFLIVNKPVGLVVHKPFPLFTDPTLVDWLIASYPTLKEVGLLERPGIVHRLDKDTSGVMVVARNTFSLSILGDRFKNRQVQKKYLAIVHGQPQDQAIINEAIGRHPFFKHKMTTGSSAIEPREALTNVKVLQRFDNYALVECKPVTGRTHQIRVHLTSLGHPLLGDQVYGGTTELINRQALHAASLSFEYDGQQYHFEAPLPDDMQKLIKS